MLDAARRLWFICGAPRARGGLSMRYVWAVLVLSACEGGEPSTAPDDTEALPAPLRWDVGELGRYQVGFSDADHTYSTLGVERTIRISVWYPTEATDGEDVRYSDRFEGLNELGGAAPAAPAFPDGYPVLLYSHGDQGFGATSSDLMRWFASHGWLAIAPDHTDNTLWADVEPDPQSQWYDRPLDLRETLDWLEALPAEHPLAGLADTSTSLVAGHSRGATTVVAVLGGTYNQAEPEGWCAGCTEAQRALFEGQLDPRLKAGLFLDGTSRGSLFGESGHTAIQVPLMLQSAGDQQAFVDASAGLDLTWVWLEGSCHQTFALGLCGTFDPSEGFRLVDTYALAFARRVVLGDEGEKVVGVLEGEVVLDERVRVGWGQ